MYSSLLPLSLLGALIFYVGCSSRSLPQATKISLEEKTHDEEQPRIQEQPRIEEEPHVEEKTHGEQTLLAEEKTSRPTLLIHLNGARSNNGKYACALFANSDDFASRANPVAAANLPLEQSTWKVSDLPPGRYAAAVFHDENLNDKLDRHALGYPTEAYSFSNNARGRFGPPRFEDAEFEFNDQNLEITIDLK